MTIANNHTLILTCSAILGFLALLQKYHIDRQGAENEREFLRKKLKFASVFEIWNYKVHSELHMLDSDE